MIVSFGQEYEKRLSDGSLAPLSDKDIAAGAYVFGGKIYAPCITWVKDFPGQVTNGRIGRPAVRYCPLEWHPIRQAERVKRRLKLMGAGE